MVSPIHLFYSNLFCASSTFISAVSEVIAFLTFLFFIFDTPNLKMLGMLSIPLFINFFPNSEPIAFDPRSNPALIRFEPSPFPDFDFLIFFSLLFF